MKNRRTSVPFHLLALLLAAATWSSSAAAGQEEFPVACVEGEEPLLLEYGEHTTDCQISPQTDIDRFAFQGITGEDVRITVRQRGGLLDPRLEVWNPLGELIFNERCHDGCTVSASLMLVESGTYQFAVSDDVFDQTGNYEVGFERVPPIVPPYGLEYDVPINDGIGPVTDHDFYSFEGAAGTDVMVVLRQTGGLLDPRLEIIDPEGNSLYNSRCLDGCTESPQLALAVSGTYLVVLSDDVHDQTGSYQLSIHCRFGICPDELARPLVCDTELSQDSYAVGETVQVEVFRLANPGPDPVPVDLRTWLRIPDNGAFSHINTRFALPAGVDVNLGPFPLFTVTESTPAGAYEYGCRLLDPPTGKALSRDSSPFVVSIGD